MPSYAIKTYHIKIVGCIRYCSQKNWYIYRMTKIFTKYCIFTWKIGAIVLERIASVIRRNACYKFLLCVFLSLSFLFLFLYHRLLLYTLKEGKNNLNTFLIYRKLCDQVMSTLTVSNGTIERKILDAPVQLAEMAANMEVEDEAIKSVWSRERDDTLVGYKIFFFFYLISSYLFCLVKISLRPCFKWECAYRSMFVLLGSLLSLAFAFIFPSS